jgi:hypothetical protein
MWTHACTYSIRMYCMCSCCMKTIQRLHSQATGRENVKPKRYIYVWIYIHDIFISFYYYVYIHFDQQTCPIRFTNDSIYIWVCSNFKFDAIFFRNSTPRSRPLEIKGCTNSIASVLSRMMPYPHLYLYPFRNWHIHRLGALHNIINWCAWH